MNVSHRDSHTYRVAFANSASSTSCSLPAVQCSEHQTSLQNAENIVEGLTDARLAVLALPCVRCPHEVGLFSYFSICWPRQEIWPVPMMCICMC